LKSNFLAVFSADMCCNFFPFQHTNVWTKKWPTFKMFILCLLVNQISSTLVVTTAILHLYFNIFTSYYNSEISKNNNIWQYTLKTVKLIRLRVVIYLFNEMFLWYTSLFINKSFCQLLVQKIIQIQKNCQSRKITPYEFSYF
jgi:hypothetical protein